LRFNTGSGNTANGFDALLYNTTGSRNTANGAVSLWNNTTGSDNTANGYNAMANNTIGSYNTANGDNALYANTTGIANAANGGWALRSNTNGSYNTANGEDALHYNTAGSNNTANGFQSLFNNTAGSYNTANGVNALEKNNGSTNIALGYQAGSNPTNGNNNIEIGNVGSASDNNTILIGTQGVQTNTAIAGIYGVTAASGVPVYVTASGQLGTLTSSARFKNDIRCMDNASDALYALRPVTFKYKPGFDPRGTPQFGLVAEEVEKADPDLVARDDQGRPYTVRYQAVDAMLLNEFLKEHRRVEKQSAEIEQLKRTLNEDGQREASRLAAARCHISSGRLRLHANSKAPEDWRTPRPADSWPQRYCSWHCLGFRPRPKVTRLTGIRSPAAAALAATANTPSAAQSGNTMPADGWPEAAMH
jgi:hypothetical protein